MRSHSYLAPRIGRAYHSSPSENTTRTKRATPIFDLPSITLGLAVYAFPISALLSAVTGTFEGTLSIASRALTIVAAALLVAKRMSEGRLSAPHWAFVSFIIIYSARLTWDSFVERIPGAHDSGIFFLLTAFIPALALGCLRAKDWDEDMASKTMFAFGAVFIVVASWVLIVRGGDFVDAEQLRNSGGRYGLERLNSIYLGATAATSMLVAVRFLLHASSFKMKFIATVIAAMSFYLVYLAGSRGPILGLLFCLTIMFGLNGRGLVVAIFGLAAIGLLTTLSYIDWAGILEQLRFSDIGEDVNSISRFELMAEGLYAFSMSPLIGYGYNLPLSEGWPHNIFIEVLMATGIIGMVFFILAVLPSLMRSIQRLKSGSTICGILFLQYFVGFQFSGTLWGGSTFWIALAMVLAWQMPAAKSFQAGGKSSIDLDRRIKAADQGSRQF